jgi:redox-regulated HSP33 family molecular chaperone
MSTSEGDSGAEITHCEWCGAEYEADGPRQEQSRRAMPVPAAGPGTSEPGTHCEWCGAEYPVPGADA